MKIEYKLQLAGRRFGKLVAVRVASVYEVTGALKRDVPSGRGRWWHCACDCGKITYKLAYNLNAGNNTTCGKCIDRSALAHKAGLASAAARKLRMFNDGRMSEAEKSKRKAHMFTLQKPRRAFPKDFMAYAVPRCERQYIQNILTNGGDG